MQAFPLYMMQTVEEREALLRLFFQFLSLGHSELAQCLLRRLQQTDVDTCLHLCQHVVSLSGLPVVFPNLDSHLLSRLQCFLTRPLAKSEHHMERIFVLKAELCALADSFMLMDGEGESGGGLNRSDISLVKEMVETFSERLMPLSRPTRRRSVDSSSAQSVLGRMAREYPAAIAAVVAAIQSCPFPSPCPKEIQQFLSTIERSCLVAMDGAIRSGRQREACRIMTCVQGGILSDNEYECAIRLLVQHHSLFTPPTHITQSLLSSPSPLLSTTLQKEIDGALLSSDEVLNFKELFFPAQNPAWASFGFQEARVHNWHIEGQRLEMVLKDVGRSKFDVLKSWTPGNRRLLSLALLMGWDMLSAQNTSSTFPLKKHLLESIFPRVAAGKQSEFSGATASLRAKLQFSELLSESLEGSPHACDAASILTRLQTTTPQTILSQTVQHLDTRFLQMLSTSMLTIDLSEELPVVRDLQMVLCAGVISSVLAFLTVVADIFNGHGQIPGQDLWLSELSDLVSSIHACLCAIQGTYQHAWLLSTIHFIIQVFLSQSDVFKTLDVVFTHDGGKKRATTTSPVSTVEPLRLLRDLIKVLRGSDAYPVPSDACSWSTEASLAHHSLIEDFYNNLQLGMDVLLRPDSENVWRFLNRGNWREMGGFLSLPLELHRLLMSQTSQFEADAQNLIRWSEWFSQQESVTEQSVKTERLSTALDVIAGNRLNFEASRKLLRFTIQCMSVPHSISETSEEYLKQKAFDLCQNLASILEAIEAPENAEQSVAEYFSHGVPSKTTQFANTSNATNVRKVHEHFKAITRLRDALRDVRRGQLRYLSGLLHNLSRALSEDVSQLDEGALLEIAGYGPNLSAEGETEKGVSSSTAISYLSLMGHYLAEIGDIVSTMDDGPSEGHNYFAMLHQSPQELLMTMVANAQCSNDIDHAMAAADVLGVDLAHEVLTTWLSPLYPPSDLQTCPSPVLDELRRMPNLDALKELVNIAPVRFLVACAFAFLQRKRQEPEVPPPSEPVDNRPQTNIYEGRKPESTINCLATAFEAREEGRYPVLENWVQVEQSQTQKGAEAVSSVSTADKIDIYAQISKLLEDGSGLREAFVLADTAYNSQPPDQILYEIVEAASRFPQDDEPDGFFFADPDKDTDPLNSLPVSWVACLKIKDRSIALEAAALRPESWTLDRAIEFYSLQHNCPVAVDYLKKLKLYQKILESPLRGEFKDWTVIDDLYDRDCGQLARKLLAGGAIGFALEVVQSNEVTHHLKCDVYVEHIRSLGYGPASKGSGPIAALRFLKSLPLMEAFDTGMQVLTSCCPLPLSRMLVQYLMSLKQHLSAKAVQHLEQTRLGIAALRCLPQQWAEKCVRLVETPSLIVESLIMAQQTVSLKKMMEEVPSLRNDNLLISYARKALGMGAEMETASSVAETLGDNPTSASKPDTSQVPLPTKMTRKTSIVSDTQPGGVGLVPMTVLSGDPYHDDQLRSRHFFRGLPNLTLFRVLLDLLTSPEASALAANRIATDLADTHLSRFFGELEWNAIVAQDFQQSVDVCLDILSYADIKLSTKAGDDMQTETSSETSKNTADDNSIKIPSVFAAGPSKMRGEVALRIEVELLQKILTAGIQVSLLDLRDQLRCETLLHRLVTAEKYDLAVRTARQCAIDERPYWEAWVIACIQEGNFLSAREHVPYVFCIPSGLQMDSSRMRMEARQAAIRLVRVLETTCPIDMPAFFTLHNSLKHSRLGTMFRTSAKELVRLLTGGTVPEMEPFLCPETVGFHEKMKRKEMITVAASSTLMEDRVQFCEELLAAYAPLLLIPFMFRHARGNIACQVMYPVGMEDDGGGPSSRVHRRRERAASDRAGSCRTSSLRDYRGGSSMSSVPSEMASESDIPSPRTVPLQRSTSLQHQRSKSLTTEPSTSQKPSGCWSYTRQQSLPGNYGSTFAARNLPPLGQRFSESEYLINGVDPCVLARDVENVEQICDLSIRYATVDDMINAMQDGGTRGRRALTEACRWLENQGHYRHLYRCQKVLNRLDVAGKTCIRLSWKSTDAKTAIKFLESAKMHFQEALSVIQRHREVIDDMPIVMTQAELSTFIARTTLQLLIYKELLLNPDPSEEWSPRECTMFTATAEATTEDNSRRMRIVQRLLLRDFTLGFRVIFEFRLSETETYSNTVAAMALDRKHKAILDLVNNIKGTVSDQQLDHILLHAVSAYVVRSGRPENEEWTHWFAEGLIELMVSPHSKVRAFLKLRNVDAAYKLAELHGAQGDLSIVMEAAERHGYRSIVKNCERILGRAHIRTTP